MAYTFAAAPTGGAVDVAAYIEYVERNVNLADDESVCAHVPVFNALLDNRTLITKLINDELADWRSFQATNTYSAQSFVLGAGDGFFVRANVWTPLSDLPSLREVQENLFFYEAPHDHNFSFLTGGYWGSGYRTSIYEYDPDRVQGLPGEPVDLELLEHTALPQGKMMYYRASRDVHVQHRADEFSISLNLMITPPGARARTQYFFDVEQGRITRPVSAPPAPVLLTDLARYVGDGRTIELLDSLSARHPDPCVRARAAGSLAALDPARRDDVAARAERDAHPVVRAAASDLVGAA